MTEYGQRVHARESVVERTFTIIGAFSDDRVLTLGEIVLRTGLPKPTVYRLAMSLVATGYLEHTARGFRLDSKFYALGQRVSPYKRLTRIARPHLERLFEVVHEHVTLQVMTDDLAVMRLEYVRDARCAMPRRGGVVFWTYPHATAGGKVLLAHGPQHRLDTLLAQPLVRRTPKTITDPDQFREHLARVRENGHALSIEESRPGWVTVAAPVLDVDGEAAAAVSIVATTELDVKSVVSHVMKAAQTISRDVQRGGPDRWLD